MGRRRFRVAGNVTFALLVLGVVAELIASVWLSHHNNSVSTQVRAAAAGPAVVTPSPTTAFTIPVAMPDPLTTTALPPTTTGGVSAPVVAHGSITYTLAAGTPVEVHATGPCWLEIRQQKGGPVIDILTLATGATKTYAAPVWMRFGNADNVTVTVGSTQLKLPPSPGDLIITAG